jgi:hypothetical protein
MISTFDPCCLQLEIVCILSDPTDPPHRPPEGPKAHSGGNLGSSGGKCGSSGGKCGTSGGKCGDQRRKVRRPLRRKVRECERKCGEKCGSAEESAENMASGGKCGDQRRKVRRKVRGFNILMEKTLCYRVGENVIPLAENILTFFLFHIINYSNCRAFFSSFFFLYMFSAAVGRGWSLWLPLLQWSICPEERGYLDPACLLGR